MIKTNVAKEFEGKTPNHSPFPLTKSTPIAVNMFLCSLQLGDLPNSRIGPWSPALQADS